MHVASLELSRTLYELSGWKLDSPRYPVWAEYVDDTSALWYPTNEKDIQHLDEVLAQFPAYDLGYLLRKLPAHIEIHKLSHKQTFYAEQRKTPFAAIRCDAATPEDAACKLAIKLFKQGILTRSPAS